MMKLILFAIILFLLAIIESSVISIPLFLLFVIAWSVHSGGELSVPLVGVGGLLIDAMMGRLLGSTSLFILIVSFVLLRYERKIRSRHSVYVVIVSVIATACYQMVFNHTLSLPLLIAAGLISGIVHGVTALLVQKISSHQTLELEL